MGGRGGVAGGEVFVGEARAGDLMRKDGEESASLASTQDRDEGATDLSKVLTSSSEVRCCRKNLDVVSRLFRVLVCEDKSRAQRQN